MKKLTVLLLVAALVVMLCPQAFAQSGIRSLVSQSKVSASGACDLDLTVTLVLEESVQAVFPLPAEATEITLNGQRGSVSNQGECKLLSLNTVTGGLAGTYTFHIHYALPGIVDPGQEGMVLTLPLLSGFAYPVEAFHFSVTLPGQTEEEPVFHSSYYQEMIAAELDVDFKDNTMTGRAYSLKDHETLTMVLPVTKEMFPQAAVTARVMGVMDLVVLAAVLLAVAYFMLTMRPRLMHMDRRTTAPDGVTAGEMQMWFTGRGVDLSLLVVTWAQLGYLRLQVDDNGRVLLHKRMEMGNERSGFENRTFQSLFGHRRIVDGTGYHYAQLCRSLWSKTPRVKEIYHRRSGNPKLFRGLSLMAGMLSGVLLAAAFAPHSLFLKILLALVTAGLSAGVQCAGAAMPQRHKLAVWIGAGCAMVWMLLGVFSGEVMLCFLMLLFQLLTGLSAVYGGRRTLLGQQTMEEILQLRRHFRSASQDEILRLHKANPDYFYEMAPYALALALDRRFAQRFSRLRLRECNYLIVGNRRQLTAPEWAKALRSAVDTLDARAKRLPLERFTGK